MPKEMKENLKQNCRQIKSKSKSKDNSKDSFDTCSTDGPPDPNDQAQSNLSVYPDDNMTLQIYTPDKAAEATFDDCV